ncbi:SCO5389 family protein [Actinoallomurus sp. NPDC052274]|uniref:SCO5389 family protein n=1 Tax=Actinoallomurus sp. NPDC052274 TaxID=3155420 RepID=UPI00343AEAF9
MSLTVSPQLLQDAQRGDVDDAAFVDCIRTSLPYGWQVVTGLVEELRDSDGEFADNKTPPPDETARGQLLRMMASDAMRAALENHFGVRLAFQNCHRVAVFRPGADRAYRQFITARAQILNQEPELVDC